MSIVFTEVRIEDRDGVELSFMEGGCLDEFDIRELLKHDQPFRDMWDAVGSDARIAVQQYRFRGGKQGEELGDENHFALMRAYDRALSDEDGSTFVERDDVDWLDDFELTKDDLADGKRQTRIDRGAFYMETSILSAYSKNECQKYFDYLEQLRQSGETNMYGAASYLQEEFPELRYAPERAKEILLAWFGTFEKGENEKC